MMLRICTLFPVLVLRGISLYCQEDYIKINRQPYFHYQLDTVDYYLSEFNPTDTLPLVVYIQGSGSNSLFYCMQDGTVKPQSGHISWAYNLQDKARLLIIEKPGVSFCENLDFNRNFHKSFSLESWSTRIVNVVKHVIRTEAIDTSKLLVVGHSEGGVVAARVASKMGSAVSHVAVLAGEGPSQLYSLYRLAEEGKFFNAEGYDGKQRTDSLLHAWEMILDDPKSTEKMFFGFSHLRWSTFLQTSVIEELEDFNGRIFIAQGTEDLNVHPDAAKVMFTSLLAKGRNVELFLLSGADHSFNYKDKTERNGWGEIAKMVMTWYLE